MFSVEEERFLVDWSHDECDERQRLLTWVRLVAKTIYVNYVDGCEKIIRSWVQMGEHTPFDAYLNAIEPLMIVFNPSFNQLISWTGLATSDDDIRKFAVSALVCIVDRFYERVVGDDVSIACVYEAISDMNIIDVKG